MEVSVEKRLRKRSKRLSESTALLDEEEPPAKKTKRTKSTTTADKSSKPKSKSSKQVINRPNKKSQAQAKGSKKLIVSLDFANNERLSLGGVPISKLNPQPLVRSKGQRSSKSLGSECSSPGNNSEQSVVIGKQTKFKNPKFCFSYLSGNKKKTWKNLKQIMTAEKGLGLGPNDPTYGSVDAPPLLKPVRKYSDLSGLLAKYTDPLTGIYYSSSDEFALLRTLPSDIIQGYLALRGKMTIT